VRRNSQLELQGKVQHNLHKKEKSYAVGGEVFPVKEKK